MNTFGCIFAIVLVGLASAGDPQCAMACPEGSQHDPFRCQCIFTPEEPCRNNPFCKPIVDGELCKHGRVYDQYGCVTHRCQEKSCPRISQHVCLTGKRMVNTKGCLTDYCLDCMGQIPTHRASMA